MRIVFMGTPDFAVPSLKALVEGGYSVVGVVTQPDRPKGRGKKLAMSPVKEYAIQQGIPVLQPERISRDGYEDLLNLHPDLCVTAAFGQILSQKILDIPPLGTINVHASLLPKHRGSAPIAWAMVQGDKTTGVTTMMTARGIDNGDMLLKAETPIDPAETCGELTARLSEIGAKLLMDTLKALENGTLERIPQDESQMTYDPKLEKDMGVIDWTQDAADIVHRIHGLNKCCPRRNVEAAARRSGGHERSARRSPCGGWQGRADCRSGEERCARPPAASARRKADGCTGLSARSRNGRWNNVERGYGK